MVSIVTKQLVYDYVIHNPGSSPKKIADDLDAPLYTVNKRLLKLLYAGVLDRREDRPRLECMFYFPVKR